MNSLAIVYSHVVSRSRSRSGSAASNRSGSPVQKKRRAVLSDSEDEEGGGTAAQAQKRAKILDSDNEEELPKAEVAAENPVSEGLIDAEGESSDEGVRDDDQDVRPEGCVNHFQIFNNPVVS